MSTHPFENQTQDSGSELMAGESPFASSKRKIRIRSILTWSISLLVLLLTLFLYTSSRRSAIIVIGNTDGFTITVNGKTVQSKKTDDGLLIPIYSGLYRLKIERENYLPFLTDVRVAPGKKVTIRPTFTLVPTTLESTRNGIDYVHPAEDLKSIYYLGNGRQDLFRMEVAGQSDVRLTNESLGAVSDVQWSSTPNVALLVMSDGVYLQEIPSFDFTSQTLKKVGSTEYLSPIWDPTNPNRIAAAYFGTSGEKSLVFTSKSFEVVDRKVDLSAFSNPRLIWSPDSRYLLVLNRSADTSQNNIWVYTLTDASFRPLTKDGGVRNALFNQNGTVVAIETMAGVSDPTQNHLSFITLSSGALTPLSITGNLRHAAWRNNLELLTISPTSNELTSVSTSGAQSGLGYTFPNPVSIKGMWYFPSSKTLIYTSDSAVYTISLDQ